MGSRAENGFGENCAEIRSQLFLWHIPIKMCRHGRYTSVFHVPKARFICGSVSRIFPVKARK